MAWNTQFRGASLHQTNAASDEAFITNRVPHYWNHDLSIGFDVSENYRLMFGVNNVLDAAPPQVPSTYLGLSGVFDTIGRNYFMSANIRF